VEASLQLASPAAPSALPLIPGGQGRLEGRVRVQPVLETPLAVVIRWRCTHDGPDLWAERFHTTWVVKLTQHGTSRIHSGEWDADVDSGVAVIYPPGVRYRSTHPAGCNDTGWTLAIRRDLGEEIFERSSRVQSRDRPTLLVAARPACAILRRLVQLPGTRDPLTAERQVLDVFETLARSSVNPPRGRRPTTERSHRRVVERTRGYLCTNLAENVPVARIAREVGASPAHLSRLFKHQTGVSIGRYLRQLRLAAVIELIVRGGMPLAEVAQATGFCSQSHLTTALAREIGMPPGRLRDLGLPIV